MNVVDPSVGAYFPLRPFLGPQRVLMSTRSNLFVLIFICMCLCEPCVCRCPKCQKMGWKGQSPLNGITDNCEPPKVGAGTWVLIM